MIWRNFFCGFLVVSTFLLLQGCSSVASESQSTEKELLPGPGYSAITYAMTKEDLSSLLGEPLEQITEPGQEVIWSRYQWNFYYFLDVAYSPQGSSIEKMRIAADKQKFELTEETVAQLMGKPVVYKDSLRDITWSRYPLGDGWYVDMSFSKNKAIADVRFVGPGKEFALASYQAPNMEPELVENNTTLFVPSNIKARTLSDFSNVELGMSYNEVIALVGEPTGFMGSGIVWDCYSLGRCWSIALLFQGGDTRNLLDMEITGPGVTFALE